jgi:KaiC/GvpD/RAD55 family RecA-like ATPase
MSLPLRTKRIFITDIEDHTTLEKGAGGFPSRLYENKANNSKNPIMQIPNELLQFVRRDTYSLLVKGDAGAGKTTLSLTILRALRITTNFFYISTRLSPKQLFIYYPWLGKYMDIASQAEMAPEASAQRTSYNAPSFEDARLDEPESLFERITNQLMDVKSPIIIIDSWDAVASFMDKEARLNNERVLQTWRERAGAKLIFISENPNDTTLDFLVDGIVNLNQNIYRGARIRELTLTKLRGIRINKFCYIFSLNNGTFKSYGVSDPSGFMINRWSVGNQPNIASPKGVRRKLHIYKSDPTKLNYIRSGYKNLDTALGGGFPKKSLVFLHAHPQVSIKVLSLFLACMISKMLEDGNPTIIHDTREIDAELIRGYVQSHPSSEAKTDMLRIFSQFLPDEPLQEKSGTVGVAGSIRNALEKTRRNYPDRLLVNMIGLRACRDIWEYGEQRSSFCMRNDFAQADLTYIIGTQAPNDESKVFDLDVHLYIQHVRGTLVMHSIVPETHPFAIVVERSSRYPMVKLEPLL